MRFQLRSKNCIKNKNNRPGKNWIEKILKPDKDELLTRMSQSIKLIRAMIDHKTINNYFDNLSQVIQVVNYNETNFTNDSKLHRKRAKKIIIIICYSLKFNTLSMMCIDLFCINYIWGIQGETNILSILIQRRPHVGRQKFSK